MSVWKDLETFVLHSNISISFNYKKNVSRIQLIDIFSADTMSRSLLQVFSWKSFLKAFKQHVEYVKIMSYFKIEFWSLIQKWSVVYVALFYMKYNAVTACDNVAVLKFFSYNFLFFPPFNLNSLWGFRQNRIFSLACVQKSWKDKQSKLSLLKVEIKVILCI